MIVYDYGHRINNETSMTTHACLYFRVKKVNSTKEKTSTVTYVFLSNYVYKFPYKILDTGMSWSVSDAHTLEPQ